VFRVRSAPVPQPPPDQATVTSLSATATSAVAYQTLTYTATVTTADGTAVTSGTVTFTFPGFNGPVSFTLPVTASGTASVPVALRAGTHVVTATFNPDTGYLTSSGNLTIVVAKAYTTTASWVEPNPIPFDVTGYLYAQTTPVAPSNALGPIQASWATDYACWFNGVPFNCVDGIASPVGSHLVRIDFLGNADYHPSSSTFTLVRLPQ